MVSTYNGKVNETHMRLHQLTPPKVSADSLLFVVLSQFLLHRIILVVDYFSF